MPLPDPLDPVEAMLAGFEHTPDLLLVVTGPRLRVAAVNAAGARHLPHARRGVEMREKLAAEAGPGGPRLLASYDALLGTGQPATVTDAEIGQHVLDWTWTPWCDDAGTLVGAVAQARVARAVLPTRPAPGDLVTALQDALLPSELPIVPGLDIAARYVFAADTDHAGGDWFDVVMGPGDLVRLVVGDVVGTGPSASVTMGQLRAVLHERLTSDREIHEAMAAVDRFAGLRRESYATTVCVVEIDPHTGSLSYLTAGHPPPLVVRADGTARYLPPTGGSPLATGGGYPVVHDQLGPGEVVLLYTDGIVERPGTTHLQGTADLAAIASAAVADDSITRGPLSRAAERVVEIGVAALTELGQSDDVTLLAAQRVPVVEPLLLELTTAPGTSGTARRALTRWLGDLAPRELDDVAIQHAVGELVMNAVEHAYGPQRADASGQPGAVRLSAHLAATGRLEVTVADRGQWREPAGQGSPAEVTDTVDLGARGRGIAMVRGFVDRLEVETDEHGTRATVHHQLSRSAALLMPPLGAILPEEDLDDLYAVVEDGSHLWIAGRLDAEVIDDLRLRLARAGRSGGAIDVRIDLSDVTHLGSAAVAVLHEALHADPHLILVAPSGSVAEQVLELVRLPYTG